MDLFASRTNAKVGRFFSLCPEDGAMGLDAFAHPWEFPLDYAFPIFWLLPRGLVAPRWPKRPWFMNLI